MGKTWDPLVVESRGIYWLGGGYGLWWDVLINQRARFIDQKSHQKGKKKSKF